MTEHRSGGSDDAITTGPPAGRESFEQWYVAAWPRLVRFLQAQAGGNASEAAEVASEAMARAYERWDTGTVRNPTAWVCTVGLNLLRGRARRQAREQLLLPRLLRRPPQEPQDEPWAPDVDLVRAIAGLPERQRTAIYLRYVADLTQAEVAQVLGITRGSAASLLHTARHKLEQRFGRAHHGGDHGHP